MMQSAFWKVQLSGYVPGAQGDYAHLALQEHSTGRLPHFPPPPILPKGSYAYERNSEALAARRFDNAVQSRVGASRMGQGQNRAIQERQWYGI